MYYLITPNGVINIDHVDCVKWDLAPESSANRVIPVAYVSFESGKKERLEGVDAQVLKQKFAELARGAQSFELEGDSVGAHN